MKSHPENSGNNHWAPYPKDTLSYADLLDRIAALEVVAYGNRLTSLYSSDPMERQNTIYHVITTIHDVVTAVGKPVELPMVQQHAQIGRPAAGFFYTARTPRGSVLFGVPVGELAFVSTNDSIVIGEMRSSKGRFYLLTSLPEYSNPHLILLGAVGRGGMQTYPGAVLDPEQASALADIMRTSASSLALAAKATIR